MTRQELIERLEKASVPCRSLDAWLEIELRRQQAYAIGLDDEARAKWIPVGLKGEVGDGAMRYHAPGYSFSVDAAIRFAYSCLPGWSWRVATCCVSDDAWVQPDFNCPTHGERLRQQFDEAIDWVEITDVDLRPSGRPAIALCISVLTALEATEGTTV